MVAFQTIVIGMCSGISRSLVGYIKNLPKDNVDNNIDWNKAIPSLIVGGAIGIYSALQGISLLSAEGILTSMGITYIAGEAWSFIVTTYKNKKLLNAPKKKK